MSESIHISGENRQQKYESLLPQIKALTAGEPNRLANMANTLAALKYGMGFFWVGLYFAEGNELVLGPFQGTVACTRITKGKGVCGYAFAIKKTVIVKDVDLYPGHIACSSSSRSEIVIPAFDKSGEVSFVLDVDSDKLADFDETDQQYLEQVVRLMESF
jgi:L-methionine (R)-S-oxide reductase